MKLNVIGRKITVRPSFTEKAEQKLKKLDKFFDDAQTEIVLSPQGNRIRVEITVRAGGVVFRAEEECDDALMALDSLEEIIVRQIRRNKTRLERRLRAASFDDYPYEEEDAEYEVVRTKRIPAKPLTVDEAILQMNLVGHQFYMFRNADTNQINVVYCRKNGDYGLLEPED